MWIPPAYSPIRPRSIIKALFARRFAIPELEGRLTEWYKAERALATGSGTQALQLAIRAALSSVGGRGTIALPAYNCFDVVSATVWVGAPVVFYDIDPMTLAPEPQSLASAVAESAVLVVANLYGFPLNWDLIRDLAGERQIPVVEDAAQGMGATWKGQAAGTFGDLSVLSFGRGKGWTGGTGGAVLARHGHGSNLPTRLVPAPSSRVLEAMKLGAIWILAHPLVYGVPSRVPALRLGETSYHPPREPTAISSFAAAVVVDVRAASQAETEVRRGSARRLRESIRVTRPADPDISFPEPLAEGESGYLRLPILCQNGRLEHRQAGRYRGYPMGLPTLEAIAGQRAKEAHHPGAKRLLEDLVTAPTHSRSGPIRSPFERTTGSE